MTYTRKLAKHFQNGRKIKSVNEAFRQLARKYEDTKDGLWIIYVKAYNYDMSLKK